MAKLAYFEFYPGDWTKDPELRLCSLAARGFLVEMLCLMFECEDRGVLASQGRAWNDDEIAGAVAGDKSANLSCLHELLGRRAISRRDDGAVFSRKMVRMEKMRQNKAKAGRRGMHNRWHNRLHNKPHNRRITTSEVEVDVDVDVEKTEGGVGGKRKADLLALDGLPQEFACDAFKAAWADWVGHRRDIRHPLTPRMVKAQFAKFATMGVARAVAALTHSIANGWQGVFEPDADSASNRPWGGDPRNNVPFHLRPENQNL